MLAAHGDWLPNRDGAADRRQHEWPRRTPRGRWAGERQREKDDGKGIDPERILTAALQNNLIDLNKVSNLTRDQKINLIFEPGLSTIANVSEVSGRGAGMDAVKVEIDRLKGDIQIKTEKDQGTTFEIHIPDVT